MNRRRQLALITFLAGMAGIAGLALVFAQSMGPTDATKVARVLRVDINDIPLNGYRKYAWNGRAVAVFRLGDESRDYLLQANSLANAPHYAKGTIPAFFVYEPVSTFKGCGLVDSVKNDYLWPKYRGWYDPCHMGFWDYSGRNFPGVAAPPEAKLANLKPVSGYRWLSDSVIEFQPGT